MQDHVVIEKDDYVGVQSQRPKSFVALLGQPARCVHNSEVAWLWIRKIRSLNNADDNIVGWSILTA